MEWNGTVSYTHLDVYKRQTLNSGAEQVFNTLLSTADTQIAAAGLTADKLTIKNYDSVLEGLI